MVAGVARPETSIPSRAFRADQALVAVVVLAGFVFGAWWALGVAAALLALATVPRPGEGLAARALARLGPPGARPAGDRRRIEAAQARSATLLGLFLVGLGLLLALAGFVGAAWVPALAAAASAALDAGTGTAAVFELADRVRGAGRG